MRGGLLREVQGLCEQATAACAGTDLQGAAAAIQNRLREPLRVAIAGRIKAGKSTLLNALVGEGVAPTDAGECTRIATSYRNGLTFEVVGETGDGPPRPFPFRRGARAVEVDLGGIAPEDVRRLEVRWPSRKLEHHTLIDTPGLDGSAPIDTGRRLLDKDDPGQADAVIYLMHHLHRTDAAFLEAFLDRSLSQPSPFNAIAILSRADEIGAGRVDALRSARAVAERYAADERVRALCATVVPVAGLIAETAATLTEDETAVLREIAGLDDVQRDALLLSVDRFRSVTVDGFGPEWRHALLSRFGLFGIRFSVAALRAGQVRSATDLAELLRRESGIDRLVEILDRHFRARSDALRARSALSRLKSLARRLQRDGRGAGPRLLGEIERVESRAIELALLRLIHLLLSGQVDFDDEARDEILRLGRSATPAGQLGASEDDDLPNVARGCIEAWRERGAHPLNDPTTAEACDIVARAYEDIYRHVADGDRGGEEEHRWAAPATS